MGISRLLRLSGFLSVLRSARGTSTIEFAIIAPVFAFMAMGIADLSRGLARKFQIEQASYRALELVTVGFIQSDYTYVKPEAATAAGVSQNNVTVTNWLECDGVRQNDFNGACASGQQTARFVKVAIFDDFKPTFSYGPLGTTFGRNDQGLVRLTARSTLRVQ